MMLPQLSEERPRLAGPRTALTGYHSRNCGLCPDSLEKIKEKREGKKSCVKGAWEGVSFSADAGTLCSDSVEARIHNGACLTM